MNFFTILGAYIITKMVMIIQCLNSAKYKASSYYYCKYAQNESLHKLSKFYQKLMYFGKWSPFVIETVTNRVSLIN